MSENAVINDDGTNVWEAGYTALAHELIDALDAGVGPYFVPQISRDDRAIRKSDAIADAIELLGLATAFCAREDVQALGLRNIIQHIPLAVADRKAAQS